LATTIAVAGKGGTGKTTFSALLIQLLAQRGTVLAIDADPSTNLNMALGLDVNSTIGDAREEMLSAVRGGAWGAGLDKREYLDARVNEALVESSGVDLIAMGRPSGPGCYCAANNMLRASIDKLTRNYDYVVIDNEAGLEHLSRGMTRDVDVLVLVSDVTLRGIVAAARAQALAAELDTTVGKVGLVVNRTTNGLPAELSKAIQENGLDLWATLPADSMVADLDAHGQPTGTLPEDAPVRVAVSAMARAVGIIE
jgi:CO dehydrogenase maturation factor